MIFGSYPCCDGDLSLGMPDRSGTYAREFCPHCATPVWHKFSRIQSCTWTEEEFLKLYEIDDETKQIREKNPAPPPSEVEQGIRDILSRGMGRFIAKEIIGDSPMTPPSESIREMREQYRKDNPDADT